MNARIEALGLIRQRIWDELLRAAQQREHGWRTMALATLGSRPGPDGTPQPCAQVRSMVLREVEAGDRRLVFYTDLRSAKVAQLQRQPEASAMAWCPRLGWQLRLALHLTVRADGLAVSDRWARLKLTPAAQDYLSPLNPGAVLATAYTPERGDRGHFAMLEAEVMAIDWLELHALGPRRAGFDAAGAGQWLSP